MALPGEIDVDTCPDCGRKVRLQVLQSGAGYYIGTQCDVHGPISRESEYFQTYGIAAATLEQWHKGNKEGKRDTEWHPDHEPTIVAFGTTESETRSRQAIIDLGSNEPSEHLTAEHVNELMMDCLHQDYPLIVSTIVVSGVMHSFAFAARKIEEHHEQIHQMLLELPREFYEGADTGGWSFLNLCLTKDGHQWTGAHAEMEALMVLGLAAGWLDMPLSKNHWMLLPGGVPYVVVRNERKQVEPISDDELAQVNAHYAEQEGL